MWVETAETDLKSELLLRFILKEVADNAPLQLICDLGRQVVKYRNGELMIEAANN
jgi:hypothetical protein